MTITVIILNYNTKGLLKNCLNSLMKNLGPQTQIIVIDNASRDGTVEMVKDKFPNIRLIQNKENLGYSAGNNVGLKKIKSDLYLLLNSDTLVLENSLNNLVEFAKGSDFGIVSCRLEFASRKFQPNAGDLPFGLALFTWLSGIDGFFEKIGISVPSFHKDNTNFYKGTKKVGWVSGTAMLIKSETIDKIGYLDENIFMYGEDVEYCYRALKNRINTGWTNEATIVHLQGGSSEDSHYRQWLGEFRGILYLYKKYFGVLNALIVNLLIRFFIVLRIIFFFIIGKHDISKTYAKVFINI